MIRSVLTVLTFILAVSFSTAHAATYSWTDEQGTTHFTEDLGTVPQKFRKKALRAEEMDSAPEEATTSRAPVAKSPETPSPAVPTGRNSPEGVFAGKTYDQWQQELTEREATMATIRKRIDEIDAGLGSVKDNWIEQNRLLQERKGLSTQFKEMKAQYFQQVEIARKGGLQIDIQQ